MAQRQSKKSQVSLQKPKMQDDVLHEQMPVSPLLKALQRDNELIEAAKHDDYEKAKLLLEEGVNINTINKKGETALHFPAWAEYARICRLLIEKGADGRGDRALCPIFVIRRKSACYT